MVQAAELEGSLEGTLVLDTGDVVFHRGRYIEHPVKITFREGRAIKFEGGLDAFLLHTYLESFADDRALLGGHVAWGTDRRALWTAQVIQFPEPGASAADAESFYGNVQIEIGSNNDVAFQGKNATQAHLGLCMLNCSLYLDDQQILGRGQFVPEELR
jgi:2,5-dihydroxypyridine 5,6-dioxygenase